MTGLDDMPRSLIEGFLFWQLAYCLVLFFFAFLPLMFSIPPVLAGYFIMIGDNTSSVGTR
jgi:hypothetical protein